jgi:23S rRNA (uracil1939-C5)-methyltransferase
LSYDAQCLWKEKLFLDTLLRQCHIEPESVLPLVPADSEFFYRSRAQVKCQNSKNGFLTGFYRPKSHFVVAVSQCHILAPSLNSLLTELRELFNGTNFADAVTQLDLALDDRKKRCVTVHYRGKEKDKLGQFLSSANLSADILVQPEGQKNAEKIKGQGILQIEVAEPLITLNYSAGSFAQINLSQNKKLVEVVTNLTELSSGMCAVDLYCGMGNFTLPMSQSGAHVIGIEESSASISQAIRNAELNSLNKVDFICGNAEDKFHELASSKIIDVLLLDPPRSGAFELLKSIMDMQRLPEKIIYVSCDPQTLARDLNILLQKSYRFISSQPFDLFPQTYHCESVTLLERI